MLVTIPAGRWYGVAHGAELFWDGNELVIEPTEVVGAERDDRRIVAGWRTRPGTHERGQVVTLVDASALPPQLAAAAGLVVIPASGWWQGRAEGDLVMDVHAVVPVTPDPEDDSGHGTPVWAEAHGLRLMPDGSRSPVVELARLDALPAQWQPGGVR